MIVIRDAESGCRLVSVQDAGWLFYSPTDGGVPGREIFLAFDDYRREELEEWASLLTSVGNGTYTAREVFFSRDFGEFLFRRLLAVYERQNSGGCSTCSYRPHGRSTCATNPLRCRAVERV